MWSLIFFSCFGKNLAATCIGTCGTGKVPICAACSGGVFELGGVNIGHFMKNNHLIH